MRRNEDEMQGLSMDILLKLTQKSLASFYQVLDINESNMHITKYSMTDLIQLCGSKADSHRDLLSFNISFTSMLDLKKITSYFIFKTTVFLLFSVIAQKGKLNIYIGRTRNLWIISNPLIEKKLFESLGEALIFVIRQGFVLKIVNYLKAGCSSEKEIWKNNELEDLEKYRLKEKEIKVERKNVCFSKENVRGNVQKFFKIMDKKCSCELCSSFVNSGDSFLRFKRHLV